MMNMMTGFNTQLAFLLVPISMAFYMHMLTYVSGWVYKIFASLGVWAVIVTGGYWLTMYVMLQMLEVNLLTSIGTNSTISISATLGLLLSFPLKAFLYFYDRRN